MPWMSFENSRAEFYAARLLHYPRHMTQPVSYFPSDDPAARYLPAKPEPIMLRPAETALIIVDMQNAYASPGGYTNLAGFDISGAPAAIANIKQAAAAARAVGMPVIYFQNGWDPDYVEAGGPGSPNWHKSNALKLMRRQTELQGKLLAKGGWDYELVQELPPQPGDIVVCLGAGNITQWAYALPGELAALGAVA